MVRVFNRFQEQLLVLNSLVQGESIVHAVEYPQFEDDPSSSPKEGSFNCLPWVLRVDGVMSAGWLVAAVDDLAKAKVDMQVVQVDWL